MSHVQEFPSIRIEAHPTEDDYRHARESQVIWRKLDPNKDRWGTSIPQILWLLLTSPLLLAFIAPIHILSTAWSVDPIWVVAIASFLPLLVLVLTLQILLKPDEPKSSGVVEKKISIDGQNLRRRGNAALLILFLVIAICSLGILGFDASESDLVMTKVRSVPGGFFFAAMVACTFGGARLLTRAQKEVAKKKVAAFPGVLLPQKWEFSENDVIRCNDLVTMRMSWNYLYKFLETPNVVILYPDDQVYYVLPKTAFANDDQFDQFMGLLTRKVSVGVLQPREGRGFAVKPLPVTPLSS